MRKILFSAIALMMSVTLWAAGAADSSKAINFDWDGENRVEAGTTVKYSLGLHELVERANEPVIALYLNNLSADNANVTITADAALHIDLPFVGKKVYSIDDFSDPKNYTIAGEGHEIWTLPTTFDLTDVVNSNSALKNLFEDPKNVSLVELCVDYGLQVYLQVSTSQLISIATTVYEKEEIVDDLDFACADSEPFDWATGATVAAGEKWFYLDLKKVKADEKLNFVVENGNGAEAKVSFDLYLDCPTTSKVLAHVWDIPAYDAKKESLGRFLLNQISSDYVYLKLTTNQTVTLKVEAEKLPAPTPADNLFDATAAATWNGEKLQLEAGVETIVKVVKADLKADKGYKTVCYVTNYEDVETTLTQVVSFEPVATVHNSMEKVLTVAPENQAVINISSKMLDNVKSDVAYFSLKANGNMAITIKKEKLESSNNNTNEPSVYAPACEDAYVFNWNSTLKQKALQNKWYEFDLKPLKQNNEHVQLSFTNHSDSMVIVMGSILLDCNSTDSIPYVLPVPAGKTISKVLEYSLLAASPVEKAYVSVMMIPTAITSLTDLSGIKTQEDALKLISLNANAQISLTATKSSAYVDPTLCENTHETLQAGVKYTQAAGTTQWYHVTDKFIKDMGLLSTFAIGNNGKAAANVTLGVTVGCNHGIHTRTNLSIPTWLDVTTIYPNGLFNLVDAIVNEDITEFYLEVTTDQPIEFGFGVEIENKLGCDNAADFDWSKGVTFEPNAPHWYKFDISELKANKEQVKLTFSNPTNSWAWVAAFATYDCPFKVGLPLVFPVPANTTVDKWIDYSFLASTPKEDLYFLVYTDSPLQLKAEKETAKVTPTTDCTNAIVVEPNTPYTINPGTSWYKLSPAPFAKATGKSAKITFANKSGKTAKVTTGATVGCEYGILTRGKFPVPAMNVDVNVPLWVFGLLKQFVDEDVNQYYVEVTTDQPLNFRIDVELAAKDTTVYGYECQGATLLHPVTSEVITDDFQEQTTITYVKDNVNYTHVFTPLVAGGKITEEVLNSIEDGKPVLKAGEKPVVDTSIAAIQKYYKSLQTATDSVTEKEIKWVVIGQKENSEDTIHVAITDATIVPLCATSLKMRLVITDECNNGANLSGDFEFTVDNNYGQAADAGVVAEDIKVFCGQAIDVRIADDKIKKFIEDNKVDPNAKYVWEEKNANGEWVEMSKDAIPGTVDSVTVRYVIKTDYECNIFKHTGFTLDVETPTHENDPEDMAKIELVSRYGDRLLTVHIKSISEKFGWNVAEEDVTWYKEGEAQPVGTGYYLTTPDGASLAAGTYYALIEHTAVDSTDCDGTLSTIKHEVKAVANGPKLAPSAVQPQELITIFNLNAEQVSNISIYRSTGELLESFQVNKQEQTTFNAAQQTGIYLVEILTETEKVTLRYIVK